MTTYDVFIFVSPPYSLTNTPPIKSLFTAPKFENIIYKDLPKSLIKCDTRLGKNCGRKNCGGCDETYKMKAISPDYEAFKTVLESHDSSSGKGVVIVKSSTVSNETDPDQISTSLSDAEAAEPEMDLFYFAKWLDRSDQFNILKEDILNGSKLVRTWNPHGIQAIAFTPKGFEKLAENYNPSTNPVVCRPFSQVLNVLIQSGNLIALTKTPSLMQYDSTLVTEAGPTTDASSLPYNKFSYLKTAECRGENHPIKPYNRRISGNLGLFWTIIVLIVALIVAWVLLKVGAFYATPYSATLSKLAVI